MKRPRYKPGDRVCHVLRPEVVGMVGAIVTSFNGSTYRVVWPEKLEDSAHFAQELMRAPDDKPAAGFG
jgi:hypothetical protein